jgi:predicted RNA-binding Zn-ribbon protein involved in translation (DUF1610 family)
LEGASDTLCPKCKTVVVKRSGFGLIENKLKVNPKTHEGKCPRCSEKIYGSW